MGTKLKLARMAAVDFLEKEGHPVNVLLNKSANGLCNMLGLRYVDGTHPKGDREKKDALIQWSETRNKIVLKKYMSEHKESREQKVVISRTMKWKPL